MTGDLILAAIGGAVFAATITLLVLWKD